MPDRRRGKFKFGIFVCWQGRLSLAFQICPSLLKNGEGALALDLSEQAALRAFVHRIGRCRGKTAGSSSHLYL